MNKNAPRRSDNVTRTLHVNGVTKRKPASAKAFTACRSLQSAKAVLEFLGLSYSQFGIEYSRLAGGRQLSRQSVYKMVTAKRLSDDMLQVIGQLVSNRLTRICNETIGVSIMQNSPLMIVAYRRCDECQALYAIDRPDVRRCKKHRRS